MLCPSCGRDNRSDAAFCDTCAARLDPFNPPLQNGGQAGIPAPSVGEGQDGGDTPHPSASPVLSQAEGSRQALNPLPQEERRPDETRAPESRAGSVFVGRQREMGELAAALDDALSGRGRLVMLVGEPGIGKTRTGEELAALAQQQGAQVLWGRCYEEQGVPPYWPWVQVIRSHLEACDAETLRAEMGPGAADIAEVVSEVRDKLLHLQPPPALEPEQARFRLFDSIATFVKNAAKRQPLLLVLEDLHWADKPSLLLLEFVARELAGSRLLVLGTYRDVELSRRHPLSETLGGLARERLFQRVLLRGLGRDDVDQFIEATTSTRPPPGLLEAVYTQTEGNPFFMVQVIRLLEQEGGISPRSSTSRGVPPRKDAPSGRPSDKPRVSGDSPSARGEPGEPRLEWSVRIPEGVREVIGRRLNHLSEDCNRTLTIASVIGRKFDFRQLRPLVEGFPEDRLLELLEEASAARVVEELAQAAGSYQFTHALIQETLLAELSATRQVRLHARIAEGLEALYGADAGGHAAELAHHFAESEAVLGTEKLVKYSLLAGERALAAYAHEEALAHFQRGLTAKGVSLVGTEPANDGETAALLFGLGRAQLATLERYRLGEGLDNLRCAFDYYAAVGDVTRAVSVAGYPVPALTGHRTGRVQLISRALELVPPDSHEAGFLLSTFGHELGIQERDYEGAQEAFSQALAIAQREQDASLEMRTLAYACRVDFLHLRLQEGVGKGLRAIALAPRADDLRTESIAHEWTIHSLLSLGDPEGASPHEASSLTVAERLRDRNRLMVALHDNEMLHRLKGDWQAARDFNNRILAVSPQDVRYLSNRTQLEYEVGDFGQGEAYLERLLEAIPLTIPGPNTGYALPAAAIPAVTRITGVFHRLGVAEAAAEKVLSSPYAVPSLAVLARIGLALLAVLRTDAAAAEEQYAPLEPSQGTMLIPGFISGDRILGLLAQTMGQLDKAVQHFEDALAFCRQAGYRPELAWTCCDYAEALLRPSAGSGRADSANRTKAMSLLEEALAISTELGMKPLMERVAALQEQVQPQPRRGDRPVAPTFPGGLTQREVEVLRLIAAGKSNREIAETLVISLRTAANHVANILNKTNAANRAEAATYASRQGLS